MMITVETKSEGDRERLSREDSKSSITLFAVLETDDDDNDSDDDDEKADYKVGTRLYVGLEDPLGRPVL